MGNISTATNTAGLDTSEVDPNERGGYSILSDGILMCKIEACDIVESNNNKNHENLRIKYLSMDPNNSGSMMQWLVLSNSNQTAVDIGHDNIRLLGLSCGIEGKVEDTNQLHNKTCCIEVGHEPQYNDPSKMTNIVKRWIPKSEWESGVPTRTSAPAPAPAPATTGGQTGGWNQQ